MTKLEKIQEVKEYIYGNMLNSNKTIFMHADYLNRMADQKMNELIELIQQGDNELLKNLVSDIDNLYSAYRDGFLFGEYLEIYEDIRVNYILAYADQIIVDRKGNKLANLPYVGASNNESRPNDKYLNVFGKKIRVSFFHDGSAMAVEEV